MDQVPQQPKGNFIGFHNRNKQKGDKRPNFDGRIAIPGADREFRMALWAGQDKNGQVMFTGISADISASDTALEQIDTLAGVGNEARNLEENNLKLRPHQLVVFKNSYKDEANPERPDFYGRWNPGTGDKLVNVSIWARKGRFGQPMLTGQTQYPLPEKDLRDAAEATPTKTTTLGVDQDRPF